MLIAVGLVVLLYLAALAATVWAFVAVVAVLVRAWNTRHRGPRHCPRCGYDLTGNTTGVCPECGARAARGS